MTQSVQLLVVLMLTALFIELIVIPQCRNVDVIGPNHIMRCSPKHTSAQLGLQNSLVPSLIFMMSNVYAISKHTWDHRTDKLKSQFLRYTYFSYRNVE